MSDALRRILNWAENRSQNVLYPAQYQQSTSKGSFSHVYLRSSHLKDLEGLEHIFESYAKQIRELTLRDNCLTTFPRQLLSLCFLTSLSLACNQISYIPEGVFPFLPYLQWLTLAENLLRHLPLDLARCTRLKGLSIQGNNFYEFPYVICELNNLETLLLQRNKLVYIPSELILPDKLQTLHLASNMLCDIPDTLIDHPPSCLTHLYLSGNPLGRISPLFLTRGYKNLITLDLHTCMLANLDAYFFRRLATQCPDLRRLNLAINFITQLPEEIGLLSKLQWLNLNDNQLKSLPSTIGSLTQVVKIGLVQNKLEDLPHRMFSRLQKLRKLDIRRNRLRYFPSSMLATASLKEVSECVSLGVAFSAIPRPASYLDIQQSKENDSGSDGNGGGSLRTLLFYDNQWMDSSGGIFCKVDLDTQEYVQLAHLDDLRWGMQTEQLLETPACLRQVVKKSMQDVRRRLMTRAERERTQESQLRVQKYDKAIATYYGIPSLREIALRAHLKAVMDSHDSKEPPYIDAYPEQRQGFLDSSLADSRVPERLREQVCKTAQQCDVCGYWYSQSQYQLGYSARLCDNLLNVPIRYRVCSIDCIYNGIFAMHNASYVWGSCISKIVRRNVGLHAASDEDVDPVENEHRPQTAVTNIERGFFATMNRLMASLDNLLGFSRTSYDDRVARMEQPMVQHERIEDVSHVTFPAPVTTAFNHFPRDAIRLERF